MNISVVKMNKRSIDFYNGMESKVAVLKLSASQRAKRAPLSRIPSRFTKVSAININELKVI